MSKQNKKDTEEMLVEINFEEVVCDNCLPLIENEFSKGNDGDINLHETLCEDCLEFIVFATLVGE